MIDVACEYKVICDLDTAVKPHVETLVHITRRFESYRPTSVMLDDDGHGPKLSPDFHAVFDASHPPLLVVAPSDETIVAANGARVQATGTTLKVQIGRPLSGIFPDDPGDPDADGMRNLTASLELVIVTRAADMMVVRYSAIKELHVRSAERW